jgi:hypothetical protein
VIAARESAGPQPAIPSIWEQLASIEGVTTSIAEDTEDCAYDVLILELSDARLGIARESRRRDPTVKEGATAQILTVMVDQIEGMDRGIGAPPTAQLLEP